jgi:ATP-dependent Lon protease
LVLWTVGLAGMMNVDHAAHLGGFLGGIALSWALSAPDDATVASRRWAWSAAAVAVALPAALAVIPRSGSTAYDVAAMRLIRQEDIPRVLRILPLRNAVLFPAGALPMAVHRHEIALIEDAVRDESVIGVVTQRRIDAENPGVTDLYSVGTVGRVASVVKMSDDNYTVVIQGLARFKVLEPVQERPYLKARIVPIDDETPASDAEVLALALDLKTAALDAIKAQPGLPPQASDMVKSIRVPGHLADLVAANMDLQIEDKQQVLETVDLKTRMKLVRGLLTKRFGRP